MSKQPKALMFLLAYYKEDQRPRREASALAADGWDVEVICLNKGGEPREERFEGVNILRADMARSPNKTVSALAGEYIRFMFACLRLRGAAMFKRDYAVIISHNMPNFLVFASFPAKLRGTPVILDMHDSMISVFDNTLSKSGGLIAKVLPNILRLEERLSMAFANARVTVTQTFSELFRERSGNKDFFILHNAPDTSRLNVNRNPSPDGMTRLLHHGNIHERNGVQIMFGPLSKVNSGNQRFLLEVQGRGPYWDDLKHEAARQGVSDYLDFGGPFDYHSIVPSLEIAHAGVVVPEATLQMQEALHVKFLEYAACKVPIIARRLDTLLRYFPEDCAFYVDTDEDIVAALETLRASPEQAKEKAERAYERLQKISWDVERPKYLEFVRDTANIVS